MCSGITKLLSAACVFVHSRNYECSSSGHITKELANYIQRCGICVFFRLTFVPSNKMFQAKKMPKQKREKTNNQKDVTNICLKYAVFCSYAGRSVNELHEGLLFIQEYVNFR